MLSSRNLLLSLLACGSVAAVVIACGSEDESKFDDPNANPGVFSEAGLAEGSPGPNVDVNDPFTLCSGDKSPIGGTLECPDDKNKPGCGCNTVGEKAACWTGARINRNVGVCKDGQTTCIVKNENLNVWGPCEGQVLPQKNGKGEEACSCFSYGVWKINNTSPCLWTTGDGATYWAHSTTYKASDQSTTGCDGSIKSGQLPGSGIWSTDTLKVDCAGKFKLCFKIRAGKFEAPDPNDCTLGEVCIDADYKKEGVEQPLPDLPHWVGKDPACAKKWEKDTNEDVSPGYGEMIVKGQTQRCESIDNGQGGDFVFHRVKYCPRICRPGHEHYQPNHPECKDCQLKGTGEF